MKVRDYVISASAVSLALACSRLMDILKLPPVLTAFVLAVLTIWILRDVGLRTFPRALSFSFLWPISIYVGSSHPTDGRWDYTSQVGWFAACK
jgi:hypothetical protein